MPKLGATPRTVTTVRLTRVGRKALERLADRLGQSQAGIIERAVRELAKREKIDLSDLDAEAQAEQADQAGGEGDE